MFYANFNLSGPQFYHSLVLNGCDTRQSPRFLCVLMVPSLSDRYQPSLITERAVLYLCQHRHMTIKCTDHTRPLLGPLSHYMWSGILCTMMWREEGVPGAEAFSLRRVPRLHWLPLMLGRERLLCLSGDERLWVNSRVALTLIDKMKGHFSALKGICPLLALFVSTLGQLHLSAWYILAIISWIEIYTFFCFPLEMWCGNWGWRKVSSFEIQEWSCLLNSQPARIWHSKHVCASASHSAPGWSLCAVLWTILLSTAQPTVPPYFLGPVGPALFVFLFSGVESPPPSDLISLAEGRKKHKRYPSLCICFPHSKLNHPH